MGTDRPSSCLPLVSEFAHDPDMAEIVVEFLDSLPERIETMESAWRDGATRELSTLVHQLKGAGGGYGYPSITEAAGALEARLKGTEGSGPDSDIRDRLSHVVTLCRRAIAGRRPT
ncbi:MAG: Hpt domain-containing protein [Phycisphaeraceae bacterium]|nr:Hpt domain-containing protein [Phycisphaeraceae bacterium]